MTAEIIPINSAYSWCIKMRDSAKDVTTAYHYHQLAQLWRQREGGPCNG
ncbi:hypothetical protein [Leclercia sp.]|nr:hypothetical protein [Leclercia sp.]